MTAPTKTCDVLVVGTGASGFTAAITARKADMDVLIVEKEAVFGGTTATSGGGLWVPGNHHSPTLGPDTIEDARTYIRHEAGNYYESDRVEALLKHGKDMVTFLERETEVKFYPATYPDYHQGVPGSSVVRSIFTHDYEARKLGPNVKNLKNILPQTMFMGMAVGSGVEMKQFMNAGRTLSGKLFVLRKLLRHFADVIQYGQDQQVVRGRALIARLARTAIDLDIPLWLSSPATRILVEDGKVIGAEVTRPSGPVTVLAKRGVILASGGYPGDKERTKALYPHLKAGKKSHATPTPGGNTGDGARFGEEAGGAFVSAMMQPAAWMPVSVIPGRKGFEGVWPHIVDRQKPGFICVTRKGVRFVNESGSYHDFVQGLVRACESEADSECFMIADERTVNRYGMGYMKPAPVPKGAQLRSGYIVKGATLAELAGKIGVDAARLETTVRDFNRYAAEGRDPDFGRGGNVYDHYQGDDEHKPNPCLGPIQQGPFYALRIIPGEIGTYAGLKTDVHARVLKADGSVVEGLYAVGNDQAHALAGSYAGAGATLGPGMTFAYLAGKHVAGVAA